MNFGDIIKELRKKNNLKQKDLCQILNITQPTLSNYENNRRTPDVKMLIKIANYFNVSIDYLFKNYKN